MSNEVSYFPPGALHTDSTTVIQPPDVAPAWESLNPCPFCGSVPHDAPEGVTPFGTPHWVHPHCWKCGYRPGVNEAMSQSEMARQFAAFQQYIRDNTPSHPSLEAPKDDAETEALKAALAEVQAQLAELKKPDTGAGS